jgi:hypothetical protein
MADSHLAPTLRFVRIVLNEEGGTDLLLARARLAEYLECASSHDVLADILTAMAA